MKEGGGERRIEGDEGVGGGARRLSSEGGED